MRIIKTALCSFGMSGKVFHAPFIKANPGFEFTAVLERTKNIAEGIYPGVKTYRNLNEMLADESFELVIVNTPIATHFEIAEACLNAGKHVVVEKLFTSTYEEAEALIKLAKEKNRLLSVFQNRRWDSDYLTVKKIVVENLLGEIVEAEFHFDRFNKTLSYKKHKETPGPGAGILPDLGPHIIDQALQLFGLPQSVFADDAILRPLSKVPDYMELILFYEKLRVRLKGSYLVKEPVPAYILHGTRGSFLKQRADVQEAELVMGEIPGKENWGKEVEGAAGMLHRTIHGAEIKKEVLAETGNYMRFFDELHEAIVNNKPLPVTAEEGANVVKIVEAAYKSIKEKRIIEL